MAWALKPLGDRVVVKPKDRDETTKSGIVLPDTATERPQQGEVLSVGPGRLLDSGTRVDARPEGRRHRPVREVQRHRVQARGRRPADPERARRPGRHRERRDTRFRSPVDSFRGRIVSLTHKREA